MIRTWKKYIVMGVMVVTVILLCCCMASAGQTYPADAVSVSTRMTDGRWIEKEPLVRETFESFVLEIVMHSEEVEVVETLDRTKPIYEVYKDGWAVAVPVEWQWYIRDLSETYDLPETLIYGLCLSESTFDPTTTSSVGCRGLVQINPYWISTRANLEHFTDDYYNRDLYDPYDNLLTLAEMMCYAREEYGLDYSQTLGLKRYVYWHATGKNPTRWTDGPYSRMVLGFAAELVPLQS